MDLGRRNTVFGAESIPNAASQLHAVREEDENATASSAALGRAMSTRSLGLRADVPHGIDAPRFSVASFGAVPPSAASTVTLFEDFEAGLESGPQAESTPHNTVSHKPARRQDVPPMPERNPTKTSRRSSIVYIKSDDYATPTNPIIVAPTTTSTMTSIANWSSRAVRPLIPKASKLQRKISNATSTSTDKPGSPSGALRPLSLLQDRDTNTTNSLGSIASSGHTRPLTLGKKQKSRVVAVSVQDENSSPDSSGSVNGRNKNLKQLKLARSDTSKMRAILRKEEVLPDVVVRPPSMTDHNGFVYSFRD